MLVEYNDELYQCQKQSQKDSTGLLILLENDKESIVVNAPMRNSKPHRVVVDTVKYPYIDVSLLDAGVFDRRVGKALKGKEEYPVYELTAQFINRTKRFKAWEGLKD